MFTFFILLTNLKPLAAAVVSHYLYRNPEMHVVFPAFANCDRYRAAPRIKSHNLLLLSKGSDIKNEPKIKCYISHIAAVDVGPMPNYKNTLSKNDVANHNKHSTCNR